MKRLALSIISKLGYVVVHKSVWQDTQSRAHEAKLATIPATSLPNSNPSDAAQVPPGHQGEIAELTASLAACTLERDNLLSRLGRTDSIVRALERERERLSFEVEASRTKLAQNDTGGHVSELEAENEQLRRRVLDLEVYLKETRKSESLYL